MKKPGSKEEFVVYGDHSIQLLQHIIDGISGEAASVSPYSIDFQNLKKLKISIKKKFDQPYLKCKVKYMSPDITTSDRQENIVSAADRPDADISDYKVLKKRLEKMYKNIGERLTNGSLPSNIETDLFCKNAELMTTYSGYGDDMYPEFLKAVGEFKEAFHQFDIHKCQTIFSEINTMKKACHSRK